MPYRRLPATLESMRRSVDEALSDRRPNIPAAKVFKRLRDYHAHQLKLIVSRTKKQ